MLKTTTSWHRGFNYVSQWNAGAYEHGGDHAVKPMWRGLLVQVTRKTIVNPPLYISHESSLSGSLHEEYFLITSVSWRHGGTGLWSFSAFTRKECASSSSRVALLSGSYSSARDIMSLSCSSSMLLKTCMAPPLLMILQRTLKACVPEISEEIISSKLKPKQKMSSFVVSSEFFSNLHMDNSEYSMKANIHLEEWKVAYYCCSMGWLGSRCPRFLCPHCSN